MSDKNSNSFSSFADLKDLQVRLRQQEADQAQAKADAIVVKEGNEHLNPIKQKAAQLAKFSSQAQPQANSQGNAHGQAQGSAQAQAKAQGRSSNQAKTQGQAGTNGRYNNRNNGQKTGFKNKAANDEKLNSQERLEHALNRLQRKADSLNRHHDKDVAKEQKNASLSKLKPELKPPRAKAKG